MPTARPAGSPVGSVVPVELIASFRARLEAALTAHDERAERDVDAEDDIALALQRRSERAGDEIRRALERLDAGTFGGCLACGRSISFERLDAIPQAETCGGCGSHRTGAHR